MADLVKEFRPKSMSETKAISFLGGCRSWQMSSQRIRRICVFIILCICLSFLFLWQPAYLQWRTLQKEQSDKGRVLQAGTVNWAAEPKVLSLPRVDRLPDIIEQCRMIFAQTGVEVTSFSVDRFGDPLKASQESSLDYGLVRWRLRGDWEAIIPALKALEEDQVAGLRLQEVRLNEEGGEVLLKVYFSSGG